MIRDLEEYEYDAVRKIHEENHNYPMPELSRPTYVIKKAIEIEGILVGSAFLHLTSEVGLVLNKELTSQTRAKLVKEVFEEILKEFYMTELDDAHIFLENSEDTHFAQFLTKHLGFRKDSDLVLYWGKHEQKSTEASL